MDTYAGRVWAIWYERTPDTPQATFPSKLYRYIPKAGCVCRRMTKDFDTPEQASAWIEGHPKRNFFNAHIKDDRTQTLLEKEKLRRVATAGTPPRRRPRPFHVYR